MKFGSTGRLAIAACAAVAFSAGAFAQDTTGTAGQRADADRDRDRMVTLTGCVFQEQQVPGRDATLFQRWGLTEQDYVLTHVRPQAGAQVGQQQPGQQQPGQQQPGQQQPGQQQPGQQQPGQPDQQQPGQQPTGTPGVTPHTPLTADNVLRIEGKEAEQLRKYQGQQVEIRGRLDDAGWYDRAMRQHDTPDRAAEARPGEARPGDPVGTTGVEPRPDDRLASIDVESIRTIGPCPDHHPRPQQQQPSPRP